jgi:hypothetical protein
VAGNDFSILPKSIKVNADKYGFLSSALVINVGFKFKKKALACASLTNQTQFTNPKIQRLWTQVK